MRTDYDAACARFFVLVPVLLAFRKQLLLESSSGVSARDFLSDGRSTSGLISLRVK